MQPDELRPCNNGCGVDIYLVNLDGKWRPAEESGQWHQCPARPSRNGHRVIAQKQPELVSNPQPRYDEAIVRSENDLLAKQIGRLAFAIEELTAYLKERRSGS